MSIETKDMAATNTKLDDAIRRLSSNDISLRKLNLNSQKLNVTDAARLVEVLATNFTLTELDLSDNALKTEGAALLAETLKTNSTLTTLNLENNDVKANGAGQLTQVFKFNFTSVEHNDEEEQSQALPSAKAPIATCHSLLGKDYLKRCCSEPSRPDPRSVFSALEESIVADKIGCMISPFSCHETLWMGFESGLVGLSEVGSCTVNKGASSGPYNTLITMCGAPAATLW